MPPNSTTPHEPMVAILIQTTSNGERERRVAGGVLTCNWRERGALMCCCALMALERTDTLDLSESLKDLAEELLTMLAPKGPRMSFLYSL